MTIIHHVQETTLELYYDIHVSLCNQNYPQRVHDKINAIRLLDIELKVLSREMHRAHSSAIQ